MPRRQPQTTWERWRRSVLYAALSLVALSVNFKLAHPATTVYRPQVPYSPFFLQEIRAGNVREITSRGTAIQGHFRVPTAPPEGGRKATLFSTEIPAFASLGQLARLLESHDVTVNAESLTSNVVWWKSLLFGIAPTLLLILLAFWMIRRIGSRSVVGSLGRAKARRYESRSSAITFADVAGIDEAKLELAEIVDFLKNPEKYDRLGGRIPRGVLLSGPPGTGKTLLARAVAGEAGAPFFSMSASEFVEAVVGIGASRVRDLFGQAKAAAPAIVFIDELDAVGRARGGSANFGGSDEREQTLNQILTEMDGFERGTTVIVIGATNRPDVLDAALLRPGRFDRRVAVQSPDRAGRRLILDVHTRGVPLAGDVDLDHIAATTPGMVGADLANLVNEAALLAARESHETVTASDFTEALEKILLGTARKIVVGADERRRTAYHEAGHALVGMVTPGADPVRKVSIVPRGQAMGVTLAAPDFDRFNYSKPELEALLKVLVAGRAADELVSGVATTGAENDIEQATRIARQMVGRWGMSRTVGLVSVLQREGGTDGASHETLDRVDDEVRLLVETAFEEVMAVLAEERTRLDALAAALLERETLDQSDAYEIAGLELPLVPSVS